jgi:Membrane bound beta barrel domain (DUF5777)
MKLNNIKILALILMLFSPVIASAQDEKTVPAENPSVPVKHTFENGVLINNQTVEKPNKKTLDFMIQHRFGVINNFDDLGGIYAPSNIRLGLDYGVTKNLAIGIGTTKNKHYYDIQWKYILMLQKNNGGFPVTIAYYGDVARSADAKNKFYNQDSVFKAANKLSYFHEIMFARKINSHLSLQIAGTYTYYNIVDSILNQHDYIGASFIGKYKFSAQSSIQFEFDYPLNVSSIETNSEPKPNLGVGYEVSTSGHQFQIFICTANGIVNQETRAYNLNDFTKREIIIGFNITRQWGF